MKPSRLLTLSMAFATAFVGMVTAPTASAASPSFNEDAADIGLHEASGGTPQSTGMPAAIGPYLGSEKVTTQRSALAAKRVAPSAKFTGVGKVRVRFTSLAGVPATAKNVTITSTKGKKKYVVRTNKLLTLPAGRYKAEAPGVQLPSGISVSPTVSFSTFTVRKRKPLTLKVDYGIRTAVPVTIVTEEDSKGAFTVVNEPGDAQAMPGFKLVSIPASVSVRAGDFVQVPPGVAGFKNGFTGKVLRTEAGQVIAEYVTMGVAFAQINYDAYIPATASFAPLPRMRDGVKGSCDFGASTAPITIDGGELDDAYIRNRAVVSGSFEGTSIPRVTLFAVDVSMDFTVHPVTVSADCGVVLDIPPIPPLAPGLVLDPTIGGRLTASQEVDTKNGNRQPIVTHIGGSAQLDLDSLQPSIVNDTRTGLDTKAMSAAGFKQFAVGLELTANATLRFPYADTGVAEGGAGAFLGGAVSLGAYGTNDTQLPNCATEFYGQLKSKMSAGLFMKVGGSVGPWEASFEVTPLNFSTDWRATDRLMQRCLVAGTPTATPAGTQAVPPTDASSVSPSPPPSPTATATGLPQQTFLKAPKLGALVFITDEPNESNLLTAEEIRDASMLGLYKEPARLRAVHRAGDNELNSAVLESVDWAQGRVTGDIVINHKTYTPSDSYLWNQCQSLKDSTNDKTGVIDGAHACYLINRQIADYSMIVDSTVRTPIEHYSVMYRLQVAKNVVVQANVRPDVRLAQTWPLPTAEDVIARGRNLAFAQYYKLKSAGYLK